MLDVIIAGSGPSGSYLAGLLAEKGYQVLVINRKSSILHPVCCAGIIGEECFNFLERPEKLVINSFSQARVFSPDGSSTVLSRPNPQARLINRPGLDAWLQERAISRGAKVEMGLEVTGIESSPGLSRLTVAGNGKVQDYQARLAVIATGYNNIMPYRGFNTLNSNDYTIGAQVEVDVNTEEMEIYTGRQLAPGFFTWLVPTTEGKAIAGLMAQRQVSKHLNRFLEHLKQHGKIKEILEKPSYRLVPLRPPQRIVMPGMLMLGSCAGQVKPITGGGIYYGLLGARIAAHAIDRAFSNNLDESVLRHEYASECRKLFGEEIRWGHLARHFYEKMTDPQLGGIFDIIRENGMIEELAETSSFSFDWHARPLKYAAKRFLLGSPFAWLKLYLSR